MRVRTMAPQERVRRGVTMEPPLPQPEGSRPSMPRFRELSAAECERLLRSGVIGRVALATPEGPLIVPVNYVVFEDTIVVRTSAYSLLGTHARDTMVAFEVDDFDPDRRLGWSVVARGRAWAETDATEIARMRAECSPQAWASGKRNLYVPIRWTRSEGRPSDQPRTRAVESSSPHAMTGA